MSKPYILSEINGASGADLEAISITFGPDLVNKISPLAGPSFNPIAKHAFSKTSLTCLTIFLS